MTGSDNPQPTRSGTGAPPPGGEPTSNPYIFESVLMPSISKDVRNFVAKLRSLLHLKR